MCITQLKAWELSTREKKACMSASGDRSVRLPVVWRSCCTLERCAQCTQWVSTSVCPVCVCIQCVHSCYALERCTQCTLWVSTEQPSHAPHRLLQESLQDLKAQNVVGAEGGASSLLEVRGDHLFLCPLSSARGEGKPSDCTPPPLPPATVDVDETFKLKSDRNVGQ